MRLEARHMSTGTRIVDDHVWRGTPIFKSWKPRMSFLLCRMGSHVRAGLSWAHQSFKEAGSIRSRPSRLGGFFQHSPMPPGSYGACGQVSEPPSRSRRRALGHFLLLGLSLILLFARSLDRTCTYIGQSMQDNYLSTYIANDIPVENGALPAITMTYPRFLDALAVTHRTPSCVHNMTMFAQLT